MDEKHEGFYMRSCSELLHDLKDEVIVDRVKSAIKKRFGHVYVEGIKIRRILSYNKDGTLRKQSFNMLILGSPLTYFQMRLAFMGEGRDQSLGYPDGVYHGVNFHPFYDRGTRTEEYQKKLNHSLGLTSHLGLPLTEHIEAKSKGQIVQVLHDKVTVPKSVADKIHNSAHPDGYMSDIPSAGVLQCNRRHHKSTEDLWDLRFCRKIHAHNFAHTFVGNKPIYEIVRVPEDYITINQLNLIDVLAGRVVATRTCNFDDPYGYYDDTPDIEKVKIRRLTKEGEQLFGLDRLDTTCFNCGEKIKILDIDSDLSFIHGVCLCSNTNSCFLWGSEKLLRYRVNMHCRVVLLPSFKGRKGDTFEKEDVLIRMIRPVRTSYDNPTEFLRSVVPTLMSELQHARKTKMKLHKTMAKLVDYKLLASSEKYKHYYLELEVNRTGFWNEETLTQLSNVRLMIRDTGKRGDFTYSSIKGHKTANGSWLYVPPALQTDNTDSDDSEEMGTRKLRFRMAARLKKQGCPFRIGDCYEAYPIIAQYQKRELKKIGNRWMRYFTRKTQQTLQAKGMLMQSRLVEEKDAVDVKKIALKIMLSPEDAEKLADWNPDLSKSYVGFNAFFKADYSEEGETSSECLEAVGRVTFVNKKSSVDKNGNPVGMHVMGFFFMDSFWETAFESNEISPLRIRFWQHTALDEKELASAPCGIPAGAEGEMKTINDYEDDEDNFDDFHEESAANAWLEEADQPDYDNSNINGVEAYRHFKSAKADDLKKSCGVVQERKYARLRLPPMGQRDATLLRQMRNEKSDEIYPFLDFLLNRPNDSDHPCLHVSNLKRRQNYKKYTDSILKGLNPSQLEAWKKLKHLCLSFIIGPPGCGKTSSGSKLILAISCQEKGPCFVMASSNLAADEMYRSLRKYRDKLKLPLNITRMLARKQERKVQPGIDYLHQAVQAKVSSWVPEMQSAYWDAKLCGNATLDPETRMRLMIQNNRAAVEVLSEMDIVVCTAGLASDNRLSGLVALCQKKGIRSPVVAIDEASRVTVADIVPILAFNPVRLVLLGDCSQLPPCVVNQEAEDACLDIPFMKLFETKPFYPQLSTLLNETYRMAPQLCEFVSTCTYKGLIKPSQRVIEREKSEQATSLYSRVREKFPVLSKPDKNIMLCSYPTTWHETPGAEMSTSNPLEATITLRLIHQLVDDCGIPSKSIRVICMYKKQVRLVQNKINSDPSPLIKDVIVGTVDAAQGTESDIIILNTVRSNGDNSVGFLHNSERWNVALSRARYFVFWVLDYACFLKSRTVPSKVYLSQLFRMGILPQVTCPNSGDESLTNNYLTV